MGLGMKSDGVRFLPVLVCDACEGVIDDQARAIAAFDLKGKGAVQSVSLFHKGKCDPGRLRPRPASVSGSQPLDKYVPWLLWNSRTGRRFTESPQGVKLVVDVPAPLML